MKLFPNKDPYVQSNGTMKNKLRIRNPEKLKNVEFEMASLRMKELIDKPLQSSFNADRLCETHGYIFQDLYEWAGEPRTRDIFKHEEYLNGASVEYSKPDDIEKDLIEAVDNMTSKDYKAMSISEQAENFALDLRNIWEVHPFREGNTRTCIAFCCDYMESQGIPIERQLYADNSKFTRNALVVASKTYEQYSKYPQREPLIKIVKDSLVKGKANAEKSKESKYSDADKAKADNDISKMRDVLSQQNSETEYQPL